MSEVQIANPQKIAQEMAERHQRELQEARVREWVDPASEQSMAEFNEYMNGRSFVQTGSRKYDGEFNKDIEKETMGESYEDMGMVELARRIGEARKIGDKTTETNVTDVLMDKVAIFAETNDMNGKDKEGGSRQEAQDNLLNRLLKVADEAEKGPQARTLKTREEKGRLIAEDIDNLSVDEIEDRISQLNDKAFLALGEADADAREKAINEAMALFDRQASLEEWDDATLQQYKDIFIKSIDGSAKEETERVKAEAEGEDNDTENAPEEGNAEHDAQAEPETDEASVSEPVTSLEEGSQRGRLGRIFKRAGNGLRNLPMAAGVRAQNGMHRTAEYLSDEEKGNKRRKIIGVVAGVVAVAGAYWLFNRRGIDTPRSGASDSLRDALEIDGPRASRGAGRAAEAAQAWSDQVGQGEGITHSIMDYASEHGKSINPKKAFDIFNAAKENGLIDAVDVKGSGPMNVSGGAGFLRPGNTVFSADLVEFLNEELGLK